jgi:hypothetical protein
MGTYKRFLAAKSIAETAQSEANLLFALWMGFCTTHYLTGLAAAEVLVGAYVGTMQGFLMMATNLPLENWGLTSADRVNIFLQAEFA